MTLIEIPEMSAYLLKLEAVEGRLEDSAKRITKRIPGADFFDIHKRLQWILFEYQSRVEDAETETGEQAVVILRKIEVESLALVRALKKLRPASWLLLIRAAEDNNLKHPARLRALPNRNPRDPDRFESEGQWLESLVWLQGLAKQAQEVAKGLMHSGRRPISADLNGGSPSEWLANKCWEFAREHGCDDPSLVRMVMKGILGSETGSPPTASWVRDLVKKASEIQ